MMIFLYLVELNLQSGLSIQLLTRVLIVLVELGCICLPLLLLLICLHGLELIGGPDLLFLGAQHSLSLHGFELFVAILWPGGVEARLMLLFCGGRSLCDVVLILFEWDVQSPRCHGWLLLFWTILEGVLVDLILELLVENLNVGAVWPFLHAVAACACWILLLASSRGLHG